MTDIKLTLVVACALVDTDKRVLIAQRPEGKALAGLWEFPGGKVEPGERPEQTLIRELHEEIGIDVSEPCLAPLTFASHAYENFHLLMPLYICRRWEGQVIAREGQKLAWVRANKLRDYPMPPADIPLIPHLIDLLMCRGPQSSSWRACRRDRANAAARICSATRLERWHGQAPQGSRTRHRRLAAMTDRDTTTLSSPSPPPPDSPSPIPAAAASAGFHAAPSRTARRCRRWRGCGRRDRRSVGVNLRHPQQGARRGRRPPPLDHDVGRAHAAKILHQREGIVVAHHDAVDVGDR